MTDKQTDAAAWTPPPGVHATVIHGSADGPLMIALVTLDPLAEVPEEVHLDQEETIVWLDGARLRVDISERPHVVGRSGPDRVFVRARSSHVVRNPHPIETSTYLAILRRV